MKFFIAPFWNTNEHRLRAGWRLLIHFILFFLLLIPLTIFSLVFGSSPLPATIHSVGYLIGGLGVAWLMARLIDRRPYANFGFHLNRKWWLDFGFGLTLGAFLLTGIFLSLRVAGWVEITGMAVTSTGVPFILAFLSDIVLYTAVAVNEELAFRGYHLKNLAEGFHWKIIGARGAIIIALLISSTLFGLAHLGNPNADAISTFNIVLAGFALALPYILTGELSISIGLHLTWNLFEGSVYGFAVSGMPPATHLLTIQQSGPTFWTGGAFGPEAGMVCIIWLLIGCVLTVGWVKWQRKQIGLHTDLAIYKLVPKTENIMQTQPNHTVNIPWHFDAPREKVWQAWTDPEMVKLWFGSDPSGKVLHAAIDARPGGAFEITFANADGTVFTCFGTYNEVEPAQKLTFTWAWKSSPNVVEFVTVLLAEEPSGTRMDFEIADIDPNSAHSYEPGWKSTFAKLEQALKNAST